MKLSILVLLIATVVSGCGRSTLFGSGSGSADASRLRVDQAALVPGTFGGNPGEDSQVALSFGAYRAGNSDEHYDVTSLSLCVSHAKLHGYDPAGAVKYPSADLKVGQVTLSPEGTALESIAVPAGVYDRIELDLSDKCGSGLSAQVSNGFGSFNTRLDVKMVFTGQFTVTAQSGSVSLDLQAIVRQLRKVQSGDGLKPALQYVEGGLRPGP